MAIFKLSNFAPSVHESAFVAESATLIGDVCIAERASIWFGAVLRGDVSSISVGESSNIQDNAVVHADHGFPVIVGSNVTIGHQVMLHGCTLNDFVLVGMQATIMNGAVIGAHSIVGAGALVTEGKVFPPKSLILGSPAKFVRQLTDDEISGLPHAADHYSKASTRFKRELVRLG